MYAVMPQQRDHLATMGRAMGGTTNCKGKSRAAVEAILMEDWARSQQLQHQHQHQQAMQHHSFAQQQQALPMFAHPAPRQQCQWSNQGIPAVDLAPDARNTARTSSHAAPTADSMDALMAAIEMSGARPHAKPVAIKQEPIARSPVFESPVFESPVFEQQDGPSDGTVTPDGKERRGRHGGATTAPSSACSAQSNKKRGREDEAVKPKKRGKKASTPPKRFGVHLAKEVAMAHINPVQEAAKPTDHTTVHAAVSRRNARRKAARVVMPQSYFEVTLPDGLRNRMQIMNPSRMFPLRQGIDDKSTNARSFRLNVLRSRRTSVHGPRQPTAQEIKRKIQNRMSAKLARERHKDEFQRLKDVVSQLENNNASLEEENNALRWILAKREARSGASVPKAAAAVTAISAAVPATLLMV